VLPLRGKDMHRANRAYRKLDILAYIKPRVLRLYLGF
jgi:hypothetical protein